MKKLDMLAFDLGAGSGRGILGSFDGERITIEEIHRFQNEPVTVSGHIFWDILRLYHEIKKGIGYYISAKRGSLSSIGIDTWGVDYCLLDAKDRIMGNPYHYRDPRTEGMFDEAFSRIPKQEIYKETGISFEKFNTLYQLLSENNGSNSMLEKADVLLFIPDLISYFLTGVKSTEYSIASTSQLMSSNERCWNKKLLDSFNIPQKIMPCIENPGSVKGWVLDSIGEELGISETPVINVAGHDTASAISAISAHTTDYAFLSSGTWSIMGVEVDKPVINEHTFGMNYSNERVVTGFSLLKNIMGMWLLQECKREWEEEEGKSATYSELDILVENSRPFASFINPEDTMFYQPGDMPLKIRNFCLDSGQKIPETKGEIVRCIYESLALKYRQAFNLLEMLLNRHLNTLQIVGGGSNNRLLNQFTSNAIKRIVISGPAEATAVGNLMIQAMALGEVSDYMQIREVVRSSFGTREYIPEQTDDWDEAYHRFQKITERE